MSDNSAHEKQTARERASGPGRGNIGPERNQDKNKGAPTLAERYGVQKSHMGDYFDDGVLSLVRREHQDRLPKPNRVADAKAKKLEYEILMSADNARPRMPVSSRRLTERTTNQNDLQSKPCANCKGQGHKAAGCITTEHGYIKACVFCETDNHRTDDCDSFKQLSLADKVKLLVTDRAGKPALALWWNLLYEFLEARETRDIPPPIGFPWTAKFAIEVFQGKHGKPVKEIQTEFDATQHPKVLPVDTKVRSLPDVWSYYWFHESLRFPSRAHIPRP